MSLLLKMHKIILLFGKKETFMLKSWVSLQTTIHYFM